ncbi:MAG TPA: hypothetical protein VFZ09_19810, partial [Archangium sp.]|uniref:hypothetical protein n=1 Tax=Archangium sp. TaxID=1872627 RepID=UPI002E32332C
PHLFPNRGALEPDALLRFRTSLIAGGVEDQAVAEVPPVLHELNDGLREAGALWLFGMFRSWKRAH